MSYRAFLIFGLLLSTSAFAADFSDSAPVPTQIRAGKRVFLSNMGGECRDFASPGISFGAGQPLHHGQISAAVPTAYEALYASLKTWGRFEIVLNPADADLVFQIHVVCPSIKEGHPVVELQILDPKSRICLWGFDEIADPAELQRNRDANFLRALNQVVLDLKGVFDRADKASVSSTK